MRRTRLGIAVAVCLGLSTAAPAAWEPQGWRLPPPGEEPRAEASLAALPAALLIGLYQQTVSRVDGDRCPSHPTCSAYAAEAVREHGPLLGLVLTAGRILSESDEAAVAPRVFLDGRWKVYSPVEDDLAFLRGGLAP